MIPAVGDKPNSGYHAGAWDTSPYDNYKVQKDTVSTYTYAKNSSGGSSGGHHRRPTVTIPDDVPTGLNGDDHYAYIVGYPDKTVRPQNGITRAEVATIFFRLLTDETRDSKLDQVQQLLRRSSRRMVQPRRFYAERYGHREGLERQVQSECADHPR